jgi:tight adherence protein B
MARRSEHWGGNATKIGVTVIALVSGTAWFGRQGLHHWSLRAPAGIPSILAALPVLTAVMGICLWLEHRAKRRGWLKRTAQVAGLRLLAVDPKRVPWLRTDPEPLAWLCQPIFRTPIGRRLAQRWKAAGFESAPTRYLLLIVGAAASGWLVGARIAGPVLALGLAAAAPLAPINWVNARRVSQQRQIDDQIPVALDALAAGLAAGLSLGQAIEFASGELPEPLSAVFSRMDLRLKLGMPIDDALDVLVRFRPVEVMLMAVEGIQLQRQYGGDLVRMLGETSSLLRDRLELDREVRAVASQGRLSGTVVAGLVPVSAGLLLLTNPGYIDVLFDTLPGQILLVVALLLQLIGWAILGRLLRIQY